MEETSTKEEIFGKFFEFLADSSGPNGMVDLDRVKNNSFLADINLKNGMIDNGTLILIDVINQLEEHFDINISEDEFFSFQSVSDIIDNVFVKKMKAA